MYGSGAHTTFTMVEVYPRAQLGAIRKPCRVQQRLRVGHDSSGG